MSESNVRDELIEYIASGQTQKARDLLSDIPDGGVDDEGNTLYHEAVTLQDTKLLKYVLLFSISLSYILVLVSCCEYVRKCFSFQ